MTIKIYTDGSFRFHHVKGHSGDTFNDLADQLAKEALEL